jgi:hypothetical protein
MFIMLLNIRSILVRYYCPSFIERKTEPWDELTKIVRDF